MADRGLNYIHQIQNRLRMIPGYEDDLGLWQYAFEMYKDLRVDGYFSTVNPRATAGAIVYLAAIKKGVLISQRDIAFIVGLTEVTIMKNYKKIKIFLMEKENAN